MIAREDFESAWRHLLKVKSEGAPAWCAVRRREVKPAGVLIKSPRSIRRENKMEIELVVDGNR